MNILLTTLKIPVCLVFALFSMLLLCTYCVPESHTEEKELSVDLIDETVRKIWHFQAHRLADSLRPYLTHENPNYRYHSVVSFGSFSNESISRVLEQLLKDPFQEIRSAAAYAIGQTYDSTYTTSLVQSFDANDSMQSNNFFNATILEAIGKTGTDDELYMLGTISTYRPYDSLLVIGQLRGLLAMVGKNMIDTHAYETVVKVIQNELHSDKARAYAAYIISLQKKFPVDSILFPLNKAYTHTDNIELKVAILKALKNCERKACMEFAIKIIENEKDELLKNQAILILRNQKFNEIDIAILKDWLLNSSPFIQEIISQHLLENGQVSMADTYVQWAQSSNIHYVAQANLFAAGLKYLPYYYAVSKSGINKQIQEAFSESKNTYAQIAYTKALAYDVSNYKWLIEKGIKNEQPAVASTAVRALLRLKDSPHFAKIFRNKTSSIKKEIDMAVMQAIELGDEGVISSLAYEILEGTLIDDEIRTRILAQEEKVYTPEKYEAYTLIQKLKGAKDYQPSPAPLLHIDSIGGFPQDSIVALITTNKGNIKVLLFGRIAPYSVRNFIQLSESGYYDDLTFHRVVPNFVIQYGCTRSDGYSSLDYIIPTETPQKYYDEGGYIGMASAGRDTESSQWFITQAMTPHLNGKYTIFGKVLEGMSTVREIQVGDSVQSINIQK